jgi:hypothetical protein
MLGDEEWLSDDLIGRSSGRQSNDCGRGVRNGGNNNLSSDKNEFLLKRNPKEDNEWMRRRIVRLSTSFIARRREGRWCYGG